MSPPKRVEGRQVSPSRPPYPKIFYDVNSPPRLITNYAQIAQLGSAWRELDVTFLLPDAPRVALEPQSAKFTEATGVGSFAVIITGAGNSGNWTVTKDAVAEWLTIVSPTAPQTVDGPVNYTVSKNTGAARMAAMYVNGKTFTVAQAGAVQPQPQPTRQPVREAAALPPAPPQRKSEIARRPLLKKTKH